MTTGGLVFIIAVGIFCGVGGWFMYRDFLKTCREIDEEESKTHPCSICGEETKQYLTLEEKVCDFGGIATVVYTHHICALDRGWLSVIHQNT